MILIASPNEAFAIKLHSMLSDNFEIYDVDLYSRSKLDLYLKKINVDVLIADIDIFSESGIHEISELKTMQPKMHIIILAGDVNHRDEISAILFGAKAYCQRDISPTLLTKVVSAVLNNEIWVDRLFVTRLLAEIEDITQLRQGEAKNVDSAVSKLTPRESQIAKYVANGESNRKISEYLSISERTVKAHLGVIFRKMGLKDRLQLALYMSKHQQLADVWHEKKFHEDK